MMGKSQTESDSSIVSFFECLDAYLIPYVCFEFLRRGPLQAIKRVRLDLMDCLFLFGLPEGFYVGRLDFRVTVIPEEVGVDLKKLFYCLLAMSEDLSEKLEIHNNSHLKPKNNSLEDSPDYLTLSFVLKLGKD